MHGPDAIGEHTLTPALSLKGEGDLFTTSQGDRAPRSYSWGKAMRYLLSLALLILLATACGGGSDSSSNPSPTAAPSLRPTPTFPAGSPSQGTPRQGGVLRRLWLEPPTLDPQIGRAHV